MKQLKIGDLVRYRGWNHVVSRDVGPLAIVTDVRGEDPEDYHARIRVTWVGNELPIQGKVLSVNNSWTTRWVKPGSFEIVSSVDND